MADLKIPDITQEECAEVIQAISKVKRFGLSQEHPETGVSNKEALAEEIGQLYYMLGRLSAEYHLDGEIIDTAYEAKAQALIKWSKYNV